MVQYVCLDTTFKSIYSIGRLGLLGFIEQWRLARLSLSIEATDRQLWQLLMVQHCKCNEKECV